MLRAPEGTLRILLAWCLVLGAASALTGLHATAASASGTQLPLNGYWDMQVDGAHQHVFASGGSGNSAIVAMNYDGSIAATISKVPSGAGMVLNGNTLYVARQGGDAIDKVDTASLKEVGSISLPTVTAGSLAEANGRLWYQADSCGNWAALAAVDPSTGISKSYPSLGQFYCPTFAVSPASPNMLILAEMFSSPTSLYEVDVSTDPPTLIRSQFDPGNAGNLKDIAVTPDGSGVLLASGAPYYVQEISLSNLQPTGVTYPTGPYPNAVDVTNVRGGFVAGGVAFNNPAVYIFPNGNPTPINRYDFGGQTLADRGLAFSPDAAALFAVSAGSGTDRYFNVISYPTAAPVSLTLAVSSNKVNYKRQVKVTAHLSVPNQPVSIFKTEFGGSKQLVIKALVDGNGDLSTNVTMYKKTDFVAEFAGNDQYQPATSNVETVEVVPIIKGKLSGYYGSQGKYKLYHYTSNCTKYGKGCPTYTITLAPNHRRQWIYFTLQVYVGGAWQTALSFRERLNKKSEVSVIFVYRNKNVIGIPTRAQALFQGDDDHLPAQTSWAYFKITK